MKKVLLILIACIVAGGLQARSARDVENRDRERQLSIIRKNLSRMHSILGKDYSAKEIEKMRDAILRRLGLRTREEHILKIIKMVVPWAVMERLGPNEAARIIVYMDQVVQAGVGFGEAEDLIPAVARFDLPVAKSILMVRYNQETSRAGIPEGIRNSFLGSALERGWDGMSILGGGRGLVLAKETGMNLDRASERLLDKLPKKGRDHTPGSMIFRIKSAVEFAGKTVKMGASKNILNNYGSMYRIKTDAETTKDLKQLYRKAKRTDDYFKSYSGIPNKITPPDTQEDIKPGTWHVISRGRLITEIRPWIGTRYRWGGVSRRGVDCSGFTMKVLTSKRIGVPKKMVPRSSRSQYSLRYGTKLGNGSSFQAGDLIFFSASPGRRKITHVALAISGKEFYHASSSRGVIKAGIHARYWRTRRVSGKRLFTRVVP